MRPPPMSPAVRPSTAPAPRILLIGHEPLFMEGLRSRCEGEGLVVAGTALGGEEGTSLVGRLRPDVAVIALLMPRLNGYEATRRIADVSPDTKVLLLTSVVDERRLADAWRAGARGIALKSQSSAELIHAIREVAAGRPYVCPIAEGGLLPIVDAGGSSRGMLTRREGQVLQLVAEGKSIRQIATLLGISPKTAEHHREHIRKKLGVHTTAGLVRWAIRLGLVVP